MSSRVVMGLFIAATLFAACGDDGGGTNNGGIKDGQGGTLITDPSEIIFSSVALGESDVREIIVENGSTEGTLKIDYITLKAETSADGEITQGDNWVSKINLAPGEQALLSLNYSPRDETPDGGFIEFKTNDPSDGDTQGVRRVNISTPQLAARVFSRQNVIFRRVPPVDDETRNKFHQLTEVENIGEAPLTVSDIFPNPADEFSISFPDGMDDDDPTDDETAFDQTVLDPGDTIPVRVFFNPVDPLPANAKLLILSNDPEQPEYEVNLVGNSGDPCLEVVTGEDQINFGEGGIGYANNKTITLKNCSPNSDLNISDIAVCTDVDGTCDSASDIFTIKADTLPTGLPDDVAVIGPDDTASFVLTYTPVDLSVSNGELRIASNDPSKAQLTIPVTGKGTNNACPQALAEARIGGTNQYRTQLNTIPLKTIEFRGDNSVDPDGTVARYEWTLVSQPINSTTRFQPGADIANPTLFLDLAGQYTVELRVFDDNGTASCGDQALIQINAQPDEDIHVQLVWETPADSDQTDNFGTDLDLHLLHPNGQWNRAPFDLFWDNPTNEWGAIGASDDPSLDIDDTNGAGPENINLNNPESGLTYAIGVDYFSDKALGPSYATVRVYIQGQPRFEHKDQFMAKTKTFWYVATITWPSAQIFAVNQISDGFP